MIILDTNILSELIKPQGSQQIKKWVAENFENCQINIINPWNV
jgi:predicted nucleic acid-binding protein